MYDLRGYEGVAYTKEPLSQYINNLLTLSGWTSENLGVSSDPQYDVYGMSLNENVVGKPYIMIRSAVHGNEWESAYWCLDFARFIGNPKLAPAKLQKYFTMLKANYNWYWIPVHNPWGYVNNVRLNINNINLNDDLGALSQIENVYLVDKFNLYRPVSIVDNHSWDDPSAPCHAMSIYRPEHDSIVVARQLFLNALNDVRFNTQEIVNEYASSGHEPTKFRAWSAKQASSSGVNCMTWLIETDRLADVKTQTYQGFNALLTFLIYTHYWYREGVQNPMSGFRKRYL